MAITRYKDGAGVHQNYTPGTNKAAGLAIIVGSCVGVTEAAITANTLGALAMDGAFTVPKTADEASFAQGAHVYLDEVNQLAKDTAGNGDYFLMGYASEAATAGATTVRVELVQLGA